MEKRNFTVYAVDFDGTLCESVWPGIGAPNMALINHIIKRRNQGNKIILWTCREGKRLKEAVEWRKKITPANGVMISHGYALMEIQKSVPMLQMMIIAKIVDCLR